MTRQSPLRRPAARASRRLPALAALTLAAACWSSPDAVMANHPVEPTEAEFTATITREVGYRFLIYLPKDYDADEAVRWPLVVFLHGAGERGDELAKVAVHGPPMQAARGDDLPFIVVAPQCPAGSWWDPDAVAALARHVTREHRVDASRVYLTGLSMGGFGTWETAAKHPDLFAAIAPVCGGGNPLWGHGLARTPVWAFHGDADSVVPPAMTEVMAFGMRRFGRAEPRLTIYPDVGHDSWVRAYNDPELYRWLLSHAREDGADE